MTTTIDLPPDVAEITEENIVTIPPGIYPIWSPYDAYEAADAMMAALANEPAVETAAA